MLLCHQIIKDILIYYPSMGGFMKIILICVIIFAILCGTTLAQVNFNFRFGAGPAFPISTSDRHAIGYTFMAGIAIQLSMVADLTLSVGTTSLGKDDSYDTRTTFGWRPHSELSETNFGIGLRINASKREPDIYPYLVSAFGVSMYDEIRSGTKVTARFGLGFKFKASNEAALLFKLDIA